MRTKSRIGWVLSAVSVLAVAISALVVGPYSYHRKACRDNLAIIASATESTVLELGLHDGDQVPIDHIVLFMKDGKLPRCPSGVDYVIPRVGFRPTCPVHGDLLRSARKRTADEIK